MTNILAFDSLYIVQPLRKIYMALIGFLSNSKSSNQERIILYRLDQDNILLRDNRNLSGISVGINQDKIDALSIEFYRYLESSSELRKIMIKKIPLLQLYTRQTKLKLTAILNCIHRIENFSSESKDNIEIITDKQTASIVKEGIKFLGKDSGNILWRTNLILTTIISINSFIMRIASLITMYFSKSTLPVHYYCKISDLKLPTILIALPRRRPDDFYSTYVEELETKFNIILYSHGFFQSVPVGYEQKKINEKVGLIKGIFNMKTSMLSYESYVADILLIFKYHLNLNRSIDVVESLYENKVDLLINRQQTNVVDNYLAIKAKKESIFILGDIFEEIFFCDALVCSSESQNTDSVKLALPDNAQVSYKGSNSLIQYRLKDFDEKKENFLHNILDIGLDKKIIFYASDPSKEESQRYLSEKFLIHSFAETQDYIFVMKTHTQDSGKITYYSYIDAGSPSNVILIGDIRQKNKIASPEFYLFNDFDFNAAISSSDGFLTTSSSSILQALTLGVKSGIVDKFKNGYYDYLVKYNATMLVRNLDSLNEFLAKEQLDVSKEVLNYCGLETKKHNFDMGDFVIDSFSNFKNNHVTQSVDINRNISHEH